jgi:hypothetical protein
MGESSDEVSSGTEDGLWQTWAAVFPEWQKLWEKKASE